MATRKSPRLNGPPAKARKVDDQPNDAVVVVDDAIEEQTAPIFNLIDDCCYALLDWLPYEDLQSFGQTCKWAQQVAADFYKMNHSARVCVVRNLPNVSDSNVFDLKNAQRIIIWNNMDLYCCIKTYCNQSVKQIELSDRSLSIEKVNCLKKVLHTVERVQLVNCEINGDFYEGFLKFCTNIKSLHIYFAFFPNGEPVFIGTDNGWLTRKYPTLERLDIFNSVAFTAHIDELKTFFEQNPNVRSLATFASFLEDNLDLFRTTDIQLDELAIAFDYRKVKNKTAICGHLNNLHERGVFQRLHFAVVGTNYGLSEEVASLNALEKLSVRHWNRDWTTISSLLVNIKELNIFGDIEESTMELTARNLVIVERIFLERPSLKAVVDCIRYAAKLKRIKIRFFSEMPNKGKDGLDIAVLNKEREKLAGARKVTIYVPEDVYLATKWATDQTDYSLIELKRENAYDCEEEFMTICS